MTRTLTFLRRAVYPALSIALGMGLARSFYNHFEFGLLNSAARLAWAGGLTLVFAGLVYGLVFRFARERLMRRSLNTRLLWIGVSLAWGALFLFCLPFKVPVPEKHHTLEVRALGQHNPAATSSAVWVYEVGGVDGNALPFYDMAVGEGWEKRANVLVAEGDKPASIFYYFKGGDGQQISVLLGSQPGGGLVRVRLDDDERLIDLYEAGRSFTRVNLSVTYMMGYVLMLYGLDWMGYSLLALVVGCALGLWLERRPRAALMVIVLAAALVQLSVVAFPSMGSALGLPDSAVLADSETTLRSGWHAAAWCLVLAINLAAALMLRRWRNVLHPLWPRLLFGLVLAAALVTMTDWNVFMINSDSSSYVQRYGDTLLPARPPAYPLLIEAVTVGTGFDHTTNGLPRSEAIRDSNHPLMRVARAQKALLLASALAACAALMLLVDAPLAGLLFLWLFDNGFFSGEMSAILSEVLAQTWLFLLLAAWFAFMARGGKHWLVLAGGMCTMLYLTRPAGVFALALLAFLLLYALWRDRLRYRRTVLLSLGLLALLAVLPVGELYLRTGRLISSPMYYVTQGAFSMRLAQPEDAALMPDEEASAFFEKALVRRAQVFAEIDRQYPNPYLAHSWRILKSAYDVALPLAAEMKGDGAAYALERQDLILKVAAPLMNAHRREYLQLAAESVGWAATSGTRLRGENFSFAALLAVCGLLAIFQRRGWVAWTAAAFILTHLTHLVVISLFDSPSMRYVWATEFLVVIAVFLLVWGILERLANTIRGSSTPQQYSGG